MTTGEKRVPIHGDRGRIHLRADDGVPITPATAEQIKVVEAIEWIIMTDRNWDNVPDIPPPSPMVKLTIQVPAPHCLLLYASVDWGPEAQRMGESRFVWDARDIDFGERTRVPAKIISDETGTELHLRARSAESVGSWPVQRGDRVFIEMSETRAHCIAGDDLEAYERAYPERFQEYARRAPGGPTELRDRSAKRILEGNLGDLAHVTEGLYREILKRQATFAHLEAFVGELVDQLTGKLTTPDAPDDDLTLADRPPLDSEPTQAHAERFLGDGKELDPDRMQSTTHQYTRVVLPLMRGEYSAASGASPVIADMAKRVLSAHGDERSTFGVSVSHHCDLKGRRMPTGKWAAMRRDDDYITLGHWDSVDPTDTGKRFEFLLEWIGVHIGLGDSDLGAHLRHPRVEFDLGAALSVRFFSAAKRVASPWTMLRHWPIADGTRAPGRYCDGVFGNVSGFASPAQQRLTHEVIERWMRLGEVDPQYDFRERTADMRAALAKAKGQA